MAPDEVGAALAGARRWEHELRRLGDYRGAAYWLARARAIEGRGPDPGPYPLRQPDFRRAARENVWDRATGLLVARREASPMPRARRGLCGGRRRPGARRVAATRAGPSDADGEPKPGEPARRVDDDHVEQTVQRVVLA